MSRLYQVRNKGKGAWEFGFVSSRPHEKPGMVYVADAVLPKQFTAREVDLEEIPIGNYGNVLSDDVLQQFPDDALGQYVAKHYAEASRRDKALKKFGVGALLSYAVADGYAHYVVTRMQALRTCTLEWRGYGPDRYSCPVLGAGATLPIGRVKQLWESKRRLRELFSKKSKDA